MLTGLSHQWFRPERCASQQRNRYFLHEKYATPYCRAQKHVSGAKSRCPADCRALGE
jgi:hypothetical protein